MRRWLSLARLWLPWWLFRCTRPRDELVLDWRYLHGWGRSDTSWWSPMPVRPWSARFPAVPQHLCRDLAKCPCFDQVVSGDLTIRETLPSPSHTGG